MDLNGDDKKRVYFALHNWANYIETGDPTVSAEMAEKMHDREFERRYGRTRARTRALTTEQMREVVALRDLATRFLA